MNVKQLIDKLNEFEPQTQVYIELPTDERFGSITAFADYNIDGRLVAVISPLSIPNGEGYENEPSRLLRSYYRK